MAEIQTTDPKTLLEADHSIGQITQLPTGRIFLQTEKRVYELISNVWEPMTFKVAVPPVKTVPPKPGEAGPDGVIVPATTPAEPATGLFTKPILPQPEPTPVPELVP